VLTPRLIAAGHGARIKEGQPRPKGGLKSAGTMPKSHPGRNAAKQEKGRFRKVFALGQADFAKILEMAVGDVRQRQVPAICIQKSRRKAAGDHGSDRGNRDRGGSGSLRKGIETVLRYRA